MNTKMKRILHHVGGSKEISYIVRSYSYTLADYIVELPGLISKHFLTQYRRRVKRADAVRLQCATDTETLDGR